MARSNGHAAVAVLLAAFGYLVLAQLQAFANTGANRNLRSRVTLAATQADVDAAQKDFKLKQWAASQLAGEGSPQAAAAAARAQQAEATYMSLKAQLQGMPAPAAPAPVAAAPAVAAPVAAAPVVAAPPAGAVSKADLAAAKQNAQLLTWSANKLMSEGAPQAAAMKAKADQAVAAFEAMKQASASGASMPSIAPAAAAPVAAAPMAAAPVAVAPAGAVSKEALAAAKQQAQLLTWSANKLMSEGAPQAAAMKAKADQAVAAFEAMKQAQATGAAAPAMPAVAPVAAPVAAAPVAAPAPVAVPASGASAADVEKAKKEMELHEWAAQKLAASGSLQAAVMKAKAEQSRAAYEALKESQLVAR